MRSFTRLALLALPFIGAVSAIDHVCFQDCANTSFKGFPCPGLDLACYCRLDNGQFIVRLNNCVNQKCDENTARVYREILGNYNCPQTTGGGSGDSATTTIAAPATPTDDNDDDNDDEEDIATLTATISDDVTVTATDSVTVTTSLSLIGDDFTSTIVQTFITQTIVTTESDTTRTLTITATGVAGGIGGDNSTGVVTTTPVSTAFTTLTNEEGSTVTSALSTIFNTRTVATTTTTAAQSSSTGENSASQVKSGMFLGLAAGFVALFAM